MGTLLAEPSPVPHPHAAVLPRAGLRPEVAALAVADKGFHGHAQRGLGGNRRWGIEQDIGLCPRQQATSGVGQLDAGQGDLAAAVELGTQKDDVAPEGAGLPGHLHRDALAQRQPGRRPAGRAVLRPTRWPGW